MRICEIFELQMDGSGDRKPLRGLYIAVQRRDYSLGLTVAERVPDGDDRLTHLQLGGVSRGSGFNSLVGASILSAATSVEGSELAS